MFRCIVSIGMVFLASVALAAEPVKTEEQKTLYVIGLEVARSLAPFNLTLQELEFVKQGLTDAVSGKQPEVNAAAYNAKVQELVKARRKALGEKQAAVNKEFLAKAAAVKGAEKAESGLIYLPLKKGDGPSPTATSLVKVNYRGTLPDGREFDSSFKRGKPLDVRMDGVIRCWTEGLQKMKVGGKAKLFCPPNIAYGDAGAGDMILPGATLVFEVELLEVMK